MSVPATLAGLSMAGIVPLAGFVSKESALESLWEDVQTSAPLPAPWSWLAIIGVVAGSALTVAYTARFLWGAFATKPGVPPTPVKAAHPGFVLAPVLLGVAMPARSACSPPLESPWLLPYAVSFPAGGEPQPLALWHGVTVPLLLSLVSVGRRASSSSPSATSSRASSPGVPPLVDGERGLRAHPAVGRPRGRRDDRRHPARLAARSTSRASSSSSSPLPGLAAVTRGTLPEVRLWDNPGQAVVGVVVVAAAVLVLVTRRRLTAVMLVGATGYGVSLLFILHGAPDLAITQMLVETVSLVVFVLALRRLPTKFTRHPHSPSRTWRIALGVAVGASVGAIALVASGGRSAEPVSAGFPTEAYAFGHGKNIVNVTLVDIRAWDTLGEVSVLVAAATGIASLIFVRTRNTAAVARDVQGAAVERPRRVARGCTAAGRCARRSARSSSRS